MNSSKCCGWPSGSNVGPSKGVMPDSNVILLSEKDKRLVRENWAVVDARKEDLAIPLFMKLFQKDPALKGKFRLFKTMTDDELLKSSFLKAHALGVLNQFGTFLDQLDNLEVLAITLDMVAHRHVHHGVLFFQPFETLRTVFLELLDENLGDAISPAHRDAWKNAFDLMWKILAQAHKRAGGRREPNSPPSCVIN